MVLWMFFRFAGFSNGNFVAMCRRKAAEISQKNGSAALGLPVISWSLRKLDKNCSGSWKIATPFS
jgi:hypothetical protein